SAPPSESPSPSPSPTPSAAPSGGVDAYRPLQVEDASEVSGPQMQDTEDEGGGRNAGWIGNGDYLRFDNVNFGGTPPTAVNLRVASDLEPGGRIEIRVDSASNPPLATLNTSKTGGWQSWRTETTEMSPVTGLHTVYVTFGNDRPDDFVNLNWLVFRIE
ncbi:carbohydrate-binding protein, partial [Actinoplanes sp. NPDC051633]|uniref:carbohydrate-binding protein n=1 Tax=Actinoplanes sp. NPDC051633 TaxID=3155670 RepID=UPI00344A1D80